jgi:predicted LPLAT superfamily acyltransferase
MERKARGGRAPSAWEARREGGVRPVLAFFAALLRLPAGRLWRELLLGPITLYFFLRRGAERRASRAYLRQALGRKARFFHIFRHFYVFAQTLLDRFFLLERGEEALHVAVAGKEALLAALAEGRGAVLVSAHFGSFDLLRLVLGTRSPVPVRVVMHRRAAGPLTAILAASHGARGEEIIELSAEEGPPVAALLALRETLAANGVVGLLGDRALPGQRSATTSFLGRPARFPLGPYLLAARLEAPVLLAFAVRTGRRRYEISLTPLADFREKTSRTNEYDELIRNYVKTLEALCRRHPYNWFNFYPFWLDAEERGEVVAATGPVPRSRLTSPASPAPIAGRRALHAWRRRALRLIAAAFAAPLLAAAPEPFTIDALFRRLGARPERRARFTETRRVKGLSAPLELSGTLTFRRPDYLEKSVETPRPERLLAEGDHFTLEAPGKPAETIEAADAPPLAAMIEAIRATFRGDLAALRRRFSVGLEGGWEGWTLTLVPLDPLLSRYLTSVILRGEEDELTALSYRETGGDESVLTLLPLARSPLP